MAQLARGYPTLLHSEVECVEEEDERQDHDAMALEMWEALADKKAGKGTGSRGLAPGGTVAEEMGGAGPDGPEEDLDSGVSAKQVVHFGRETLNLVKEGWNKILNTKSRRQEKTGEHVHDEHGGERTKKKDTAHAIQTLILQKTCDFLDRRFCELNDLCFARHLGFLYRITGENRIEVIHLHEGSVAKKLGIGTLYKLAQVNGESVFFDSPCDVTKVLMEALFHMHKSKVIAITVFFHRQNLFLSYTYIFFIFFVTLRQRLTLKTVSVLNPDIIFDIIGDDHHEKLLMLLLMYNNRYIKFKRLLCIYFFVICLKDEVCALRLCQPESSNCIDLHHKKIMN